MGREVEVGGPGTRSNATVTIQNSDIMAAQHATLESKIGRGQTRVSIQFLDNYGVALPGAAETIQGILLGAELPDLNGEAAKGDGHMPRSAVGAPRAHA